VLTFCLASLRRMSLSRRSKKPPPPSLPCASAISCLDLAEILGLKVSSTSGESQGLARRCIAQSSRQPGTPRQQEALL
jgi:hypothetical protein